MMGGFDEVSREGDVHGGAWGALHGGYFSSAEVAGPFVDRAVDAARTSHPEVVVDLGGGTGFLLSRFAEAAGEDFHGELVDLDLSEKQLSAVSASGIRTVCGSLTDFRRGDLGDASSRFMFLSRSTFHYQGMKGLKPMLAHVASQVDTGEYFIHQTACFESVEDALAMNMLYEMMGTGNWYPTVRKLVEVTLDCGFQLISVDDAPTLELTSESLSRRYGFSDERGAEIVGAMERFDIGSNGVFEATGANSFLGRLFYKIFVCAKI